MKLDAFVVPRKLSKSEPHKTLRFVKIEKLRSILTFQEHETPADQRLGLACRPKRELHQFRAGKTRCGGIVLAELSNQNHRKQKLRIIKIRLTEPGEPPAKAVAQSLARNKGCFISQCVKAGQTSRVVLAGKHEVGDSNPLPVIIHGFMAGKILNVGILCTRKRGEDGRNLILSPRLDQLIKRTRNKTHS